jgi:hypothetical protein
MKDLIKKTEDGSGENNLDKLSALEKCVLYTFVNSKKGSLEREAAETASMELEEIMSFGDDDPPTPEKAQEGQELCGHGNIPEICVFCNDDDVEDDEELMVGFRD